ncbi:hypothetical protein [Neisseria animalis]|uniref:hypothetical protein n=1 Tax=Neisseria animalis TaxID=492 RepID=UPI000F4ED726|nr:hypothetical protein [Neisseria animalis]VEE09286.1 Uncharacterised protein [Neisseria animalis]
MDYSLLMILLLVLLLVLLYLRYRRNHGQPLPLERTGSSVPAVSSWSNGNGEVSAAGDFMQQGMARQTVDSKQNDADYQTALQYYEQAIRQSDKPAARIIDLLSMDYRHRNLQGYAEHLWLLYVELGSSGNEVKERMRVWGSSLGKHSVFDELAKQPSAQRLQEIGRAQGYVRMESIPEDEGLPFTWENDKS